MVSVWGNPVNKSGLPVISAGGFSTTFAPGVFAERFFASVLHSRRLGFARFVLGFVSVRGKLLTVAGGGFSTPSTSSMATTTSFLKKGCL